MRQRCIRKHYPTTDGGRVVVFVWISSSPMARHLVFQIDNNTTASKLIKEAETVMKKLACRAFVDEYEQGADDEFSTDLHMKCRQILEEKLSLDKDAEVACFERANRPHQREA